MDFHADNDLDPEKVISTLSFKLLHHSNRLAPTSKGGKRPFEESLTHASLPAKTATPTALGRGHNPFLGQEIAFPDVWLENVGNALDASREPKPLKPAQVFQDENAGANSYSVKKFTERKPNPKVSTLKPLQSRPPISVSAQTKQAFEKVTSQSNTGLKPSEFLSSVDCKKSGIRHSSITEYNTDAALHEGDSSPLPPSLSSCRVPQKESQASARASTERNNHPTELSKTPLARKNSQSFQASNPEVHTGPTPEKHSQDMLIVAGRKYTALEKIKSGGTSDVFKVEDALLRKFAIKNCRLERDHSGQLLHSYLQTELELLERLQWSDRIVKLYRHEIQRESMLLVLELGLTDFASILQAQSSQKLDLYCLKFYSRQMFECVQVVHNEGIVHSDLKPGNFILTATGLKLIDFGISKLIPEYTQHISRQDYQGTVSYSAPETFATIAGLSNTGRKVGKPSDIWSCGCILYLFVYKKMPFSAPKQLDQIKMIVDNNYAIEFPNIASRGEPVPEPLVALIRGCLNRDPSRRPTVDQALTSGFLA